MSAYFSITRPHASKDMRDHRQYAKDGNKVLDLGCGNGRLTEVFDGINLEYYGVDTSKKMIDEAKRKYSLYSFNIQNDPLKIQFPDKTFDLIYCLSVFHHIPLQKYRQKFLREIRRVLKSKGTLVLTVWKLQAYKQTNIHLDKNDQIIPFCEGQKSIANRYIHAFSENELIVELESAGFVNVVIKVESRGKNKNILAIARNT
jgi:ubiquinone/menaquinone biosynthesis C-methylase UbiE